MRTRTLKKTVQKQVKKEAVKSIKTLINEFHTNKKGLMEVFGLVSTQSFNIKESKGFGETLEIVHDCR